MNKVFKKTRYGVAIMLIFSLLLQIAGPLVSYSYAEADNSLMQDEGSVGADDTVPKDDEDDRLEGEENPGDAQDEDPDPASSDGEDPAAGDGNEGADLNPRGDEPKDGTEGGLDKDLGHEDKMSPMADEDPIFVDPQFADPVLEHVGEFGNPLTGPFEIGSYVKTIFNFTIEDYGIIDTNKIYTIRMPEEIIILEELDLELRSEDDSRLLANVKVNLDGTITIQFLAEINNVDFIEERKGTINIVSRFDKTKLGDGGSQDLEFVIEDVSKEITVNFKEVTIEENVVLEKSGSYDTTNNTITWTVTVKPTTNSASGIVSNILVTDVIQAGQTYIVGSAKLNNVVMDPDPVSSGTFNHTFDELATGANQTITFQTKADLEVFKNQGDTISFKNKVSGTFGKNNTPISSPEVTLTTKVDFIKKTGKEVAGQGKINWTIEINNNNLELPAGIQIKDTIDPGLKFNDDLVINPTVTGSFVEKSNNSFTFKTSAPINEKHTITYSTDVIDPEAYKSNTAKEYFNKAELIWGGITGGSAGSGDIGVKISTSVIKKTGVSYNPANHQVTWKIVVNSNKVSITNPVVTDTLPGTLDYVSHTVSGDETWNFTNNNNDLSFKHTGTTNKTYTITLVTKIKDQYKDLFGNNATNTIENTASLTGGGITNSSSTGSQKVVSKVIQKTAKGYDYVTRKASWEIVVNQNKMPITGAVVTDVIGNYHKLVAGSLKVDGTVFSGYTLDAETNTITITLGNITTEKKITFETQIPEEEADEFFKSNGNKELSNNSSLKGDEIDGSVVSKTKQTVKNTVISKEGVYKKGNDFIDWEVFINLNHLNLNDVVLEDELAEGLIFDLESVVLNKLTINPDGSYTEGDSRAIITDFDSETNKVIFNIGDISDAYVLRFTTDVDDKFNGKTFSNSIKMVSSNGDETGESTGIGVVFQTGGAGGSGTSSRGSVTVKKVSKEDPTKITYLAGAIFELYGADKTTLVATSDETGPDGTVVFAGNNVRMGTYYIKEIQAPVGYVLDSSLKKVELKKGIDTKHITYEFLNEEIKGNISFGKTDDIGQPLAGAKFELFLSSDLYFENKIDEFITEEDGIVLFENVPYGDYKIREVQAPVGYKISNQILKVEIREDGEEVEASEEPIVNKRTIGDIEVFKRGENKNTLLPGAVFELVQDGDVKYTSDPTNEFGRTVFRKVKYGEYTLREKVAPIGYNLSTEIKTVTIANPKGKIQTFIFSNTRIRGSIVFTKKGELDDKDALEGVEFTLYRKSNNKVFATAVSDAEGLVEFKNVPYGRYVIRETSTPNAYLPFTGELSARIVTDGQEIELNDVTNVIKRGHITFNKKDDSGRPLAGAKFGLFLSSDENFEKPVEVFTTEGDGVVLFENIPYGDYKIKEMDAPVGYKASNKVLEVKIRKDGKTVKASEGPIVNKRSVYDIEVYKQGENAKTLLPGAVFELVQGGEVKYTSDPTNELGRTVFKDVDYGEYTLREKVAPIGYNLGVEPQTVTVGNPKGKTQTFIFSNTKIRGSIVFTKKGELDDKDALEGVEFTLYRKSNNKVFATAVSDAEGLVEFKNVPYGRYVIRETSTPNAYLPFTGELSARIVNDGQVIELDDVTNVIKRGHITFNKKDDSGRPLAGAKFGLFLSSDEDFKEIKDEFISGTDGVVKFENVPYGDYKIKEMDAPVGYEASSKILEEVKIREDGETVKASEEPIVNKRSVYDIEVYKQGENAKTLLPGAVFELVQGGEVKYTSDPTNKLGRTVFVNVDYGDYTLREKVAPIGYNLGVEPQTVTVGNPKGKTQTFIFNNTKIRGSIVFTKKGELDDKDALEGAEFTLYRKSNNKVFATAVSNAEGLVEFKNVPFGKYVIRETATPDAYLPFKGELSARIVSHEQVIELDDVTNTLKRGHITFDKVDDAGQALAGAKFGLFLSSNENFEKPIQVFTTGEDGVVLFENVAYGDYKIKEIQAPLGYEASDRILKVEIREDGEIVVASENSIVNKRAIGDIEIFKQGESKDTFLAGAVFELVQDGLVKYTSKPTNQSGRTVFENVDYGEYMIREKVAPIGYNLGRETKTVTITNPKGEIQRFMFSNTKIRGSIEFTKQGESNNPLAGAVFTLYKEDGKTKVATATSDHKGLVVFKDVEYGKYVIVETTAPKGYDLSDVKLKVEVVEDGKSITLETITNTKTKEPVKPQLPKTGSASPVIPYGIGLLSLLVGVFLRRKED